jgi:hypothetical protein
MNNPEPAMDYCNRAKTKGKMRVKKNFKIFA